MGLLLLACVAAPPAGGLTAPGGRDSAPLGDSAPEDTAPPADAAVTWGEPASCEGGAATPSWVDSTAALGLTMAGSTDDYHGEAGGSVIVADFDGDGAIDLAHAWLGVPTFYFRRGGTFAAGVSPDLVLMGQTWSIYPADLDGDGDLDVTVSNHPAGIFWNDGGTFTRWTQLQSMARRDEQVRKLVPADVNADGLVDLFASVGSRTEDHADRRDTVYLGDGAGSFVEHPELLAEAPARHQGFDVVRMDADGDQIEDLYVVNDEATGNTLWKLGGPAPVQGDDACFCATSVHGMGGAVGDPDGDGVPDVLISLTRGGQLLHGLADGSYVDASAVSGWNRLTSMGYGAAFADLDNDGTEDILRATGDLQPYDGEPVDEAATVFHGEADLTFTDWSSVLGEPWLGSFRGVAAWDDNGDGVLDFVMTDVIRPPRVYLSAGCTTASWLEVDVPDGSFVTITAGSMRRTTLVTRDSGFAAARPPVAHWGLGDVDTVDTLVVRFPDGREWRTDEPFAARRRVVVRPLD